MDLQDIAGLAGIPGLAPAVGALLKFYKAVENMKVCKEQSEHLRNECTDLLLVLRDNSENMVGTDYIKALDEAEAAMKRIYNKVHIWSTWSKPKALILQSEIKNGLDTLKRDLVHCVTRFDMQAQMESLHAQRMMRLELGANHAEIQERLQQLLDATRDIRNILDQPEGRITHHMRNIQEAIHANVAQPEQQHSLQERLLKIHRQTELLPPMIDLTGEVRRTEEHPVNISGGNSDVYLGEWLGQEKVALKLTRGLNQTPNARKRFIKEVDLWRQLQHRNVARLYGVATLGNHTYAVSPWMEHRDALSYLANNPNADRLKILCEVATGLEFLHKHGVVHGDLRGANILISESEVACITDFGLSVILEEESDAPSSSATSDNHGNSRWMSPELISPELIGLRVVKPNTATDVWSYGMLCLEIFTEQRPFHHRPRAATVIQDLMNGVRPTRPSADASRRGLSNALWDLMQKCWHLDPNLRPSMSEILSQMKFFQTERAGPRVTPTSPNQRLPSTPMINTAPGSSGPSPSFRSSPIPMAGGTNVKGIPSVSPVSIAPSTGSQSVSSSPSLAPPSTGDSNTSGTSNLFDIHPRIRLSPSPVITTHGKSMSLDAGPSSTKHQMKSIRPSTAEGALPLLPHVGDFHDESDSEGLGDYLSDMQRSLFRPIDIPTIKLQGKSNLEPPGVALSLPRSFVAPIDHSPSRPILDAAPSEGSGKCSPSSAQSHTVAANGKASIPRPSYIKYGRDDDVEAATLSGLVERLICKSSDFSKDKQFREIFLTSYQAFTNAEEVFNLLQERFETASSANHTAEQRASVRYSVLTVLNLWLGSHHVEANDGALLERMRAFAISIQHSSPAPTVGAFAQRLIEIIDNAVNKIVGSPPVSPLSLSSRSSSLKSAIKPSELTPKALALALTILESDRYRTIISSDCIGWIKNIPNSNGISIFITENNKLSYWVQKSILKPDEQSQRSESLKFFICVMEECRRLRNFSSAGALLAGVTSSLITGLKRTFNLDRPHTKIIGEAEKLMASGKNFQAYRKALKASTEPCVPCLHVHLHDIKVLHDSNRTFIQQDRHSDVINFQHYSRVHEQICNILRHQDHPYKPTESTRQPEFQAFVYAQLRALTVDDTLRNRLQQRAAKLARDELVDFASYHQELRDSGFIRRL